MKPNKGMLVIAVSIWIFFFVAIATAKGNPNRSASASWYGPGLYGNSLGCGGTLQPGSWGVANKSLPCGTKLTVCLAKRCADVRVIDRGPYVSGRDFDLTAAVASYIGLQGVRTVTWWLR